MNEMLLKGWTFLVVDDNPHTLNLLELVLTHQGASVYTAMNGVLGLESAHNIKPDVILCDMAMPVMDGIKMIKQLQSTSSLSQIPVLPMGGYELEELRAKHAELMKVAVIKPIYAHTFIETLLAILKDIPALAVKFN